jgi:hypothetical protein
MLKKWGVGLILASVPAWVFLLWSLHRLGAPTGDSYELGTVAMPYPTPIRVAGIFALISTLVGLLLVLLHLTQRARGRAGGAP